MSSRRDKIINNRELLLLIYDKVTGMTIIPIGCFLLLGGSAYCGTIASTFGAGGTYNAGLGWGAVGPYELAYPFSVPVGSHYIFDSASLALGEAIKTSDQVTISLATNAAGVPGSIVADFTGIDR